MPGKQAGGAQERGKRRTSSRGVVIGKPPPERGAGGETGGRRLIWEREMRRGEGRLRKYTPRRGRFSRGKGRQEGKGRGAGAAPRAGQNLSRHSTLAVSRLDLLALWPSAGVSLAK